jgi:hypothetical protein
LESSNLVPKRVWGLALPPVRLWGLLTVSLAIAACTPLRVITDFDRSATFGSYHTYSLLLGSRVDVRVYRQGTLSIDIFDAHSHEPVWHGRGTKELTHADLEHPRAPIRGAVRAILYEFPPHT